jgi:hypothetical protein
VSVISKVFKKNRIRLQPNAIRLHRERKTVPLPIDVAIRRRAYLTTGCANQLIAINSPLSRETI